MEDDRKKRGAKTTRQQYMLYLEELQGNEAFRTNKFSSENPNVIQNTWDQLVKSLNSVGGPQKPESAWKKVFSDWKSSVRKKARHIKVAAMRTGGGPPEKPLTDIEINLLNIIGTITIDGIQNVPELGVDNSNEIQQSKQQPPAPTAEVQVEPQQPLPSRSSVEATSPGTSFKRHRMEDSEGTPSTKIKKTTLLSSLKEQMTQNKDTTNNLLSNINSNLITIIENEKHREAQLAKLLDIQEKQYNLNLLKFKLKYPEVDIDKM